MSYTSCRELRPYSGVTAMYLDRDGWVKGEKRLVHYQYARGSILGHFVAQPMWLCSPRFVPKKAVPIALEAKKSKNKNKNKNTDGQMKPKQNEGEKMSITKRRG